MLSLADLLQTLGDKNKSFEILKALFEAHGQNDKIVQSRYLSVMAEVNLAEAIKV